MLIAPYLKIWLYFGNVVVLVNWEEGRKSKPRNLMRGSAVALLLGLWDQIPPSHGCMSLMNVVCCQVEVSDTGDPSSRSLAECVCIVECSGVRLV